MKCPEIRPSVRRGTHTNGAPRRRGCGISPARRRLFQKRLRAGRVPRPKVVPHVLRPSAGAARTWLGSGPGLGLGLLLWLRLRRRGWSGCYGCGRQCTNAGSRLRRRTGLAHPVKRHARARARSHCDRSVSPRHRRSPRGGGLLAAQRHSDDAARVHLEVDSGGRCSAVAGHGLVIRHELASVAASGRIGRC